MAKIAVGGCSFSDRRYNIIPWGEQVAQHFGVEYIHEAASAGSNYRIWRTLTQHILKGNLTAGDTIILQYTLTDRRECWTPHIHTNYELEHISEPYDSGTLVRLTAHFGHFALNRNEKHLAFVHNYFNNHKLNLEQFQIQHAGFTALCNQNGIVVRYLNTVYDRDVRTKDIDGTKLLKNPRHCLDDAHMNQLGHDHAAQLVIRNLDPTTFPS